MPSSPRYVVTGGAGFIGSHLTRALLEDGAAVRVLDNFSKGKQHCLEAKRYPKLSYHKADIAAGLKAQRKLLEGVDTLFHLAAAKHSTDKKVDDRLLLATNIMGTRALFRMAAETGVKKIVFTSSLYAYGQYGLPAMKEAQPPTPDTVYGISKLAGEMLLQGIAREYGLSITILRLFFIYGPGVNPYTPRFQMGYRSVILKHFARLKEGKPPVIFGSGKQALDYVHVSDAVRALKLAATRPKAAGQTINIGSGKAVSVNQLTSAISKLMGYTGKPLHKPADATEGTVRVAHPALAKRVLGWAPSIPIEKGLEDVCAWITGGKECHAPRHTS